MAKAQHRENAAMISAPFRTFNDHGKYKPLGKKTHFFFKSENKQCKGIVTNKTCIMHDNGAAKLQVDEFSETCD